MPRLAKKTLSQFVLSGCMRRLRFSLYPAVKKSPSSEERTRQDMPDPMKPRPGFGHLTKEGRLWEQSVYKSLVETFGDEEVVVGGNPTPEDLESGRCFRQLDLEKKIADLRPGQFVIEAEYDIPDGFIKRFNLDELAADILVPRGDTLDTARVRPDLITVTTRSENGPWFQLTGQGRRMEVPCDDTRFGLRVIDIKLTAEPSPAYFAEIALYSMVLADWLEDNGFSDRFFVDASGAVWPGKHVGSSLAQLEKHLKQVENRRPTRAEAESAVEEDLEVLPNDIFTARVRRFLIEDLRDALKPLDWRTLDWHVSNRCIGCDFLGYKWSAREENDDRHCWNQAEREGHLSRICGITLGARRSLRFDGIVTIKGLAAISPGNPVFEKHHTLRAGRTALTSRARALGTGVASLIPRSGTSASLAVNTKVHIFLGVEFDRASGITIAFGWRAKIWNDTDRKYNIYGNSPTIIVEERSLESERQFLLQWLEAISAYVDAQPPTAPIQFYLWDEVSYEHLARVYARHLDAILSDPTLAHVQWLFPPETVLEDSRYQDGKSPLCIVHPIVKSSIAADIPHYYSLIQLATMYYPTFFEAPPTVHINNFFLDPLSDHVPSERAHEIWSHVEKPVHYQDIRDKFRQTVREKLLHLDNVVTRLGQDLPRDIRPFAPPISVLNSKAGLPRVCWDGQLWYEFTSLNESMERFENEIIRAMPPHEREARFYSIRLEKQITGERRLEILTEQNRSGMPNVYVFRVSERSTEARIRPAKDFVSLMPESCLHLATKTLSWLEQNGLIEPLTLQGLTPWEKQTRLLDACEVRILHFDRQTRIIVVQASWWNKNEKMAAFEKDSLLPFDLNIDGAASRFAIVDPLHRSFLLKKVKKAVEAIGNPPLAQTRPLMGSIPAHIHRANRTASVSTPADRFLWDGASLAQEAIPVNLAAAEEVLAALSYPPTDLQREAFRQALSKRLFVLWGPPGTGKSETSAAVLMGKVAIARREQRHLRILLTGPTWMAIDTVCRKLPPLLDKLGFKEVDLMLVYSASSQPTGLDERVMSAAVPATDEDPRYVNLIGELGAPTKTTIIATTAHQVPRLIEAVVGDKKAPAHAELFDFILVDESSQVDIATSLLFFTAVASDACVTVVGDDLQMPPIHQANVPEGCKDIVGSLYNFYKNHHCVMPVMLDKNFRSNRQIVEFTKNAGYLESLHAEYKELRVYYSPEIPASPPAGWPAILAFSEVFRQILDPETPLVCIIHPDGQNAQCNRFEAQVTAGLVRSLYGRLASELSKCSGHIPTSGTYVGDDFFKHGVGIVTPHKAQQAEVIRLLEAAMPEVNPQEIRNAVDTVERFQGQEKDVIIATFALGDPDAIALEEEFIFGLERFNVIASRAKAKLIVLVSRELADHLPSDLCVMRSSRLLKRFVDGHLLNEVHKDIAFLHDGARDSRPCLIRT